MRANRNISRTLPGPSVVSKPTPIFSWSRQTNTVTMHPHLANARPRLPRISPPKKSTEYSRCEGAFNQFPIRRMPRYPNPVGAWFAVARQTSVLLVIKKILACYVVCLRVVVSAVLLTPWLSPLGLPPLAFLPLLYDSLPTEEPSSSTSPPRSPATAPSPPAFSLTLFSQPLTRRCLCETVSGCAQESCRWAPGEN